LLFHELIYTQTTETDHAAGTLASHTCTSRGGWDREVNLVTKKMRSMKIMYDVFLYFFTATLISNFPIRPVINPRRTIGIE
jgi:hypothetical protein